MTKNYNEYDDNELLYLISEHNEEAEKILYEKYKPVVEIKAKKYRLLGKKMGLEYNDLIQEGLIGFNDAIKGYKDNKEVLFRSFANMCVERQILSILAYHGRKKYSLLNDSSSLDIPIDGEGRTLSETITDGDDPSKMIELAEENHILYEKIYKDMTDFEKNVFDLKMLGLEYKEIASMLDKSYKSIDSALQRIRLKVKKALEDNKNN